MLFNYSFEFKNILTCSLFEGLGIEVIVPFSKGFLAGANNGVVYIFEKKNDMDPKNPFIRLEKKF
ncbi:MAG: hypothetical protein ACK52J_03835 [bacterium]|jgi:hypothetical protein